MAGLRVRHLVELAVGVVALFTPAIVGFLRFGVPPELFTGDAAALELRVLFAEQGTQLVGPYSRFGWSHPGPLFFYLALPVYKLFDHHGPALNLFMLLVTATVTCGIVYSALRLRGVGFAWLVLGVLATFQRIAFPLIQTNEWNPASPLLPLVLLSFLTVRLLVGDLALLPVCAFIGSVIVQTHVGYGPEVVGLAGLAAVAVIIEFRRGNPSSLAQWGSTLGVLVLCWFLPVWEMVTRRGGNLWSLYEFFTMPNATPHEWSNVAQVVLREWSVPVSALLRAGGVALAIDGVWMAGLIGLAIVVVVGLSLWLGRRWSDRTLMALGAVATTELVLSAVAIRAIRGEVLPYLVMWAAVPGLLAVMIAASLIGERLPPNRRDGIMGVGGAALLALTLAITARDMRVVVRGNPAVPAVAADVEAALRMSQSEPIVIMLESDRVWPMAAGVILSLVKHHVSFYVEPRSTFLFGEQLAPPAGSHPAIRFETDTGDTTGDAIASGAGVRVYVIPPVAF